MDPVLDPNTGLIYLRARYYDPQTGQFLTRDPLEALTGQPYAYAADNPTNLTDPTGLAGEAAAAGAGCAAGEVIDPLGGCGPGAIVGVGVDELGNAAEGILSLFAASSNDNTGDQASAQSQEQSQSPDCGPSPAIEDPFGNIGEDAANPLEGTTYTQKVLDQMAQDAKHGFPSSIDALPTSADASPVTGADGVTRTLVRLPGALNGEAGNYEWIIEQDGTINHRFFNSR